jgi:predicted Zn-dependent protease
MLQQLEKDVEMQTGHTSEFSFFNSHPLTEDRVEDMEKEAKDIKISQREGIAKSREDFLMKLDGLCYGENPASGVFREEKFLHPDIGFTITFPKEWKYINTPSAVGAYTEKQDGAILINGIGEATDPAKIGEAYVKKIKKEHGVVPEKAEKTNLDSYPAYYVVIRDDSGSETVHYYYVWVTMGDLTYHLIGGGSDSYHDILASTVKSLRPITKNERENVTINRIRLANAKEGESIEDFCSRTDNVWKPDYTMMINSLVDSKLKKDQLLKIAKKELYKTDK